MISTLLPALLLTLGSAPAPGAVLPFISDDDARALAEASARGVPVFVDVWAPW